MSSDVRGNSTVYDAVVSTPQDKRGPHERFMAAKAAAKRTKLSRRELVVAVPAVQLSLRDLLHDARALKNSLIDACDDDALSDGDVKHVLSAATQIVGILRRVAS